MDRQTGEIRELKVGETPRPTEVELTPQEAERLIRVERADRIRELERLRGRPITGKRARRVAIRDRARSKAKAAE